MSVPAGFYAYPSDPPAIGEAIRAAIKDINQGQRVLLTSWEDCRVGGKVVIQELCHHIQQADFFCADVTGMNANVMFELGYAIALNKRIWLTLDSSFEGSKAQFEQLRVLTTVGYAKCSNSLQIISRFYNDQPFADLEKTIFAQAIQPNLTPTVNERILYLKSRHDTEASIRISEKIDEIQSSDLSIIVDDPKESSAQPLTWYGTQVYSAAALVVHLTGPTREGGRLHNARHSLVAGMAFGMDKKLLMLAEGDFLGPIDYRDILHHYRTAEEAVGHVEELLQYVERRVEEARYKKRTYVSQVRLATELKELQLGEFIAENEADRLIRDYFVETAPFRQALGGSHTVFVGRKGSGKTANLLKLADVLGKDRKNLVCVIKPFGYELQSVVELMRKYSERDNKSYAVESLWKFLLYTEIANSVAEKLKSLPQTSLRDEEQSFLKVFQLEEAKFGGEFSVRLERCLEALIKARSGQTSVESCRLAISEALHQGLVSILRIALGEVLADKRRVAILIDNLDKPWDKQADLDALAEFLLGLLTAASRIPIDFKHKDSRRRSVNLTLTVFLRSDIFYKVVAVAREPDKILHAKLSWQDNEQLLRLIEERFVVSHEGALQPEDLWRRYFCPIVRGLPAKEYFVTRILPRPRDLVFFVKAAIATAVNRGQAIVRESDILEAEKMYSQFAFDSILVENGITMGQLESVLYEFAGSSSLVTRNEIANYVAKASVGAHDVDRIIEHLCFLSFLGLEVKESEFHFVEDPQDFRKCLVLAQKLAEARKSPLRYMVHSAFCSFLQIT